MCSHRHGLCLALPHPSARQEGDQADGFDIIRTNLSRLVNDTNAIDFPPAEKIKTIAAAKTVYEDINPHKFLHENLLGIDFPAALDAIEVDDNTTNVDFFDNMFKAFQLMDDRHSSFLFPYPLNTSVATLGFFLKIFYDKDTDTPMKRRYVVHDSLDSLDGVIPGATETTFGMGSEVLTFNGEPIDDVILALGKDSYGSNSAAQIDLAVYLLTLRVLIQDPIPFEPSVEIGYVNLDGKKDTVTIDWFFAEIRETEMVGAMMRKAIPGGPGPFRNKNKDASPALKRQEESVPGLNVLSPKLRVVEEGRVPISIAPEFQERFSVEILSTKNGPVGLFVLPNFAVEPSPALVAEITRVLKLMPENGLIMDLRDNGGGDPDYVKALVELLTGISPPQIPTVLRATQRLKDYLDSVSDEIADALAETAEFVNFPAYRGAVGTALAIGEPFSGPTTGLYTPEAVENAVDRAYFGPIVTVVDGTCYSAGDLFATLQQDLNLSLLVGVSDNVGAGGAFTILYDSLQELFSSFLDPIIGSFTTSAGRFYRSGNKAGAIIENFGVDPDIRYYPTLNDALNTDCDLFEFLSGKLQEVGTGGGLEPGISPEADEDLIAAEEPSPEEIM